MVCACSMPLYGNSGTGASGRHSTVAAVARPATGSAVLAAERLCPGEPESTKWYNLVVTVGNSGYAVWAHTDVLLCTRKLHKIYSVAQSVKLSLCFKGLQEYT